MAHLDTGGGGGGKHDKKRAKKMSTHIDMTPMVDLAFLLLTFFMLTTTFSKPKAMELAMPVPEDELLEEEKTKVNNALTLLLTKDDKLYYYYGVFKPEEPPQLKSSNYSKDGLRKLLIENYNKDVYEKVEALRKQKNNFEIEDSTFKRMSKDVKGHPKALMVLVKTAEGAKYKNIVDALDELNIANVGRYAIVDITKPEDMLLKVHTGEVTADEMNVEASK